VRVPKTGLPASDRPDSGLPDASPAARKERAGEILRRLLALYPDPRTSLVWRTPWELLVAAVLSAQTQDATVNRVTPELFRRWPGPAELAAASVDELDRVIGRVSYHYGKARNLIATARMAVDEHGGEVPRSMEELDRFPGIARKTANVILASAFKVFEGIAVDTHVKRLSFRLGLTARTDPVRIEQDLMPLFPRERWGAVNHLMIDHGRAVCTARRPRHTECVLEDICPKLEPPAAPKRRIP
jgi:endonuclease-3